MNRKASQMAALVAAALARQPGGVKQVCLDIGVEGRNTANIRKYIEAFRAVGIVYISGWTNHRFPVYSWQTRLSEGLANARPMLANN